VDDQDDRGYSRAPELEDLLSLCQALNAEGVRYVLIGGFAVILHGFVRPALEMSGSARDNPSSAFGTFSPHRGEKDLGG
jgi:hypothetical protein